jgi:hypothetical protein
MGPECRSVKVRTVTRVSRGAFGHKLPTPAESALAGRCPRRRVGLTKPITINQAHVSGSGELSQGFIGTRISATVPRQVSWPPRTAQRTVRLGAQQAMVVVNPQHHSWLARAALGGGKVNYEASCWDWSKLELCPTRLALN